MFDHDGWVHFHSALGGFVLLVKLHTIVPRCFRQMVSQAEIKHVSWFEGLYHLASISGKVLRFVQYGIINIIILFLSRRVVICFTRWTAT